MAAVEGTGRMRSAYEVLGVEPGASDEAVRKRFLDLAKVLHPDVCKRPTATTEFKELKKAYDILKDPGLRREHEYALARVETASVEDDIIDSMLQDYSIAKPRKKKKKKKKAEKSAAQIAQEQQAQQQFQAYPMPQYTPPQQEYDPRRGQGVWDGIPDGFENRDNLGGIL